MKMSRMKRFAAMLLAVIMLVGIMPARAEAASSGTKLIALTFDDGPQSKNTKRLLDGLKARGVHCTFFMVGYMAESNPDLVKRAWNEGHEIASHTYDHPALTSQTDAQIKSQLSKTNTILDNAIGYDLKYMLRPPYGDYNSRVLKTANVPCFYWSMDTYDWKTDNADSVYREFIKQARDGSIALLHDTHASSVTAALRAIDTLQAQGYEFVTLSEMFLRRGINLENGKIYFNAYPQSGQKTQAALSKPTISVKNTENGKLVTITGDSRANVYYTLDGSKPTPDNARKYTGPFYVTKNTTVTAQTVYKWNNVRSDVVKKTVKFSAASAPDISFADGLISMKSSSVGAKVYYTSDGTTPTQSSTAYTAAFVPETGTVYKARTYAPAYTASSVTSVFYSDRGNFFRDVMPEAWYYETVDKSVSDGVFVGTGNGVFAPDEPLTRAMLATALYRLSGSPEVEINAMPFTDAPAAECWYYTPIMWAYNSGILKGYDDNTIRPEQNVSRAEICAMIARYLESRGKDLTELEDVLSGFEDADSVYPTMEREVNAVCALGIMTGMPGGVIAPNENATRAQAATMVERMQNVFDTLPDIQPEPEEPVEPEKPPVTEET